MNNLKFKVEDKNKVFIDEIIQTTFASRIQLDLKIEKEIIEKKDDIEKQLNGVFSQVTYNWKMKVRNGALRGKYFSNCRIAGRKGICFESGFFSRRATSRL